MSQVDFEEVLSRAGMQARGGNLTQAPWSTDVGNVAWAGRDMGIFVVDWANSRTVELEALARKDVIVCTAVLNQDGAWTDFAVGNSRFDAKGADMTMVFVPQHERFQFATSVSRGLKAVTVVVNLMAMMEARGLPAATLPELASAHDPRAADRDGDARLRSFWRDRKGRCCPTCHVSVSRNALL